VNLAPSLNVDYNGVTQTNSTNDLSAVSTSILGPQYTPWADLFGKLYLTR
jgi:hypothetical protein